MMHNKAWLLLACLGLAMSGWGCGSAREPGQEVRGRVTLDGRPLSRGSVVLVPVQGTRGPKCYALVEDGTFHIPASQGPFPGIYRVEVYSAAQQRVPLPGMEPDVPKETDQPPVASQFNTHSRQTVRVTPDAVLELELAVSSQEEPGGRGAASPQ